MSQVTKIDDSGGGGSTTYITDNGSAAPVGGNLNISGAAANYVSGSSDSIIISWFKWNTVVGNTQAISVRNAYVATNILKTQFTLPATAVVGDSFLITCNSSDSAGWKINQNALQKIIQGDSESTTGVLGSVESTNSACVSVIVTCVTDNTVFAITSCDDAQFLTFN